MKKLTEFIKKTWLWDLWLIAFPIHEEDSRESHKD